MSFLDEFNKKYKSNLDVKIDFQKRNCSENFIQRAEGFRLIFSHLENLKKLNYQIVETGTLRNPNNWKEGNSGFLFQEFLKFNNGTLYSIDINEKNCDTARNYLDPNLCKIICGNSLDVLKSLDLENMDLFFLDSYDIKWKNDNPSADHHLEEFKILEPFLKDNKILAIDDNTFYKGIRSGKGRKIYEYLKSKNIYPVYDGYIMVYIMR